MKENLQISFLQIPWKFPSIVCSGLANLERIGIDLCYPSQKSALLSSMFPGYFERAENVQLTWLKEPG